MCLFLLNCLSNKQPIYGSVWNGCMAKMSLEIVLNEMERMVNTFLLFVFNGVDYHTKILSFFEK